MNLRGKRILAIGLAGIMIFSQTGCSSKSKTASKEDGTITLRILENDTAKQQGYLQDLLDAFNEAYASEGIVAIDANLDEYSDLAKNGPYGYGPDVLYQANDTLMSFADNKHIAPINPEDFECYDNTNQVSWDAFKIIKDGNTYYCGVPVNVQEPMLFYRADKLPDNWETDWDDNQNNTPDFLENWNDLYAYSLYLRETDTSANQNEQYGYMAPIKDVYFSSGFFFSYGGYVFGTDENGQYDTTDIGFGAGNAELGANVLRQLASVMNEGCIDDTIKTTRYEKVANGTFFCAVSTPDTYSLFRDKLAGQYEEEGMTPEDAKTAATENLIMVEMPKLLPADGDLTKDSAAMNEDDWVEAVYMGGINGYGISAYTEHKEACIEFINFATSYEMLLHRAEILGIASTRDDVAAKTGNVTATIFDNLSKGLIYLMPSCKEVKQIWSPGETFLSDLAKDPFREENGEIMKYDTLASMKAGLLEVDANIYKAIYTLAGTEE